MEEARRQTQRSALSGRPGLFWLCFAVAALAAIAAAAGLLWPSGPGGPAEVTSVDGDSVALFGKGLYRHDSRFFGAGFRGQDLVTLLLGVPVLLLANWRAWPGRLDWVLVRTALLSFVFYAYANLALGAAYNELFLLYVAIFSGSLWALVLSGWDLFGGLAASWERLAPALPRNGAALLFLVSGGFTGAVWTLPLVLALADGVPPPLLGHATTKVTEALDLALILPGTMVAAALVRRRAVLGYVLAVPLLGLVVMLVPTILASTLSQLASGVTFTLAEILGPICGFLLFGGLSAMVLWRIIQTLGPSGLPGF